MTEEGHLNRLNIQFEEWHPTGTETDKEFFDKVMPELRALKTRHYEDLSKNSTYSNEYIQVRLDYLEKRLRALKPGDIVYIGRKGNRAEACILVRWDEEAQRTKIEQFYVDPSLRSQGIGKNMLSRVFEHARQTHPDSQGLFLSTGKGEQNKARRLYEGVGFRVSSLPGDVDDEDRFDFDFESGDKPLKIGNDVS